MRTLAKNELDQVSGGLGVQGAVIGAAIGLGAALASGSSASATARAVVLGGLSGAAGNFAGSAAAGGLAIRTAWGIRSIGLGVAGSVSGNERGPKDDQSGK